MVNPTTISPTQALELTERWAREMGKSAHRLQLQDKDGPRGDVLIVEHQGWRVFVQERKGCVIVMVIVDIPMDLSENLSRFTEAVQRRVEANLRLELTSNGRTAFTIRPASSRGLSDLRRMTVEQLLRVSEDDPSSFNRPADAFQEVVTTATRASSVLAPFLSLEEVGDVRPGEEPPTNMYA